MVTISSLERLRYLLDCNINRYTGKLSYPRVIKALEALGNAIAQYEGDNDDWRYLGDCEISIDAFIVGGYWHLTEWHGGQASDSYRAMCSLGQVYSPGMESGVEPESMEGDVYRLLDEMAEKSEVRS
jgi:hypothetical protein